MTNELADWLDEITSFNLNARYDSFKREFYKLCTPEYTSGWIENNNYQRMDKRDVLDIAQEYAIEVKSKYDYVKIFLFGSYAKGNQ